MTVSDGGRPGSARDGGRAALVRDGGDGAVAGRAPLATVAGRTALATAAGRRLFWSCWSRGRRAHVRTMVERSACSPRSQDGFGIKAEH